MRGDQARATLAGGGGKVRERDERGKGARNKIRSRSIRARHLPRNAYGEARRAKGGWGLLVSILPSLHSLIGAKTLSRAVL